MDAGKVHAHMIGMEEVSATARLSPQVLQLTQAIRSSELLDRSDAAVYVMYPHMVDAVWEHYEGISDWNVMENGTLQVFVGGRDADGDWGSVRAVAYPDGRWLKMEATTTPIANPYFEAPVGTRDFEGA